MGLPIWQYNIEQPKMDCVPLNLVHPTMHQPLGIDLRVVLNNSNPNEKSFSKLRIDGTQN
jgi:hypothetical protein